MGVSFTVNRIELKRMLTSLGASEKNIDDLIANLNKMHRHANAVAFAGMLQKLGLKTEGIGNILRRIGIDDISISNIFNTLDEEKIKNTYGRIVDISIE